MSYTIDGIIVTPIGADGETEMATGTGGETTYEWSCKGKTYQARLEDTASGADSPVTVVEGVTTERGRFGNLAQAVRRLCQ